MCSSGCPAIVTIVLAEGDEITLDLLPEEVRDQARLPVSKLAQGVGFYNAISRYERELIETALERAGGVQKRAATLLGLKPTTLNEKIKRLGIQL